MRQQTIFAHFQTVAYLNNFYLNRAAVGEAHIPNWYRLLCLCPENTAWYFSELGLKRSKSYKALLFILAKSRFSSFSAILTIFTSTKLL